MPLKSKSGTPLFSREAWRYFIRFYSGMHRRLLGTSIGSASQVLLTIPTLLLVKYAFDTVIPAKETMTLVAIGVALFVLRIINSALALWMRKINIGIINTAIYRIREDLLARLYTLPRSFHTNIDPKLLHARIVQDTERLTNLSNALISKIFPSAIISLALCIVLFVLNWYLLIAILILSPLIIISNRMMGRRIKERVFTFQRVFEKFSRGMLFVLRYLDLTQIQSAEEDEKRAQRVIIEDLREETGRMSMIFAFNAQLQEVLTGLSGIVIIILGGASVAMEWMTLGDFIAFYLAASFLNRNVGIITSSFPEVMSGNESMNTLQQLSGNPSQLPYTGTRKIAFDGHLSLRAIEFAYHGQKVLNGLELDISPGERVAIVGQNGAGKTTIIQLILGFYRPASGALTASGTDYSVVDLIELRRSIGVVMQNPPLFSSSVEENICYGNPGVTAEEIGAAIKAAGLEDFMKRLPEGLETSIGEDGVRISGGERQRIAIARAVVRKPKLLILDEPTNNLDIEMVDKLMEVLLRLEYRPSILLISHDDRVTRYADKIFRLRQGSLERIDQH